MMYQLADAGSFFSNIAGFILFGGMMIGVLVIAIGALLYFSSMSHSPRMLIFGFLIVIFMGAIWTLLFPGVPFPDLTLPPPNI